MLVCVDGAQYGEINIFELENTAQRHCSAFPDIVSVANDVVVETSVCIPDFCGLEPRLLLLGWN